MFYMSVIYYPLLPHLLQIYLITAFVSIALQNIFAISYQHCLKVVKPESLGDKRVGHVRSLQRIQ